MSMSGIFNGLNKQKMKTPYLDAAIRLHSTAERIDKASDGAKEALEEFKAIKEALKQVKDIAYKPIVSGSYVAFCDGADEGVEGLVQLSCTIDNEVDGKRYCESFKSRSPVLYKLVE